MTPIPDGDVEFQGAAADRRSPASRLIRWQLMGSALAQLQTRLGAALDQFREERSARELARLVDAWNRLQDAEIAHLRLHFVAAQSLSGPKGGDGDDFSDWAAELRRRTRGMDECLLERDMRAVEREALALQDFLSRVRTRLLKRAAHEVSGSHPAGERQPARLSGHMA